MSEASKNVGSKQLPPCGVVMPISTCDGCDESHWADVKNILFSAVESAEYRPDLVSNADDVGVIQARIVKNLYENPVVVCDLSGRNANVMFELGLRLAFDKPTVIVIDDKTPFSFDTSPIEHLRYPRDLRFGKIQKFKSDLTEKIKNVVKSAQDPEYSTFLKHFGSFTASKIDKKEIAPADFVAFASQKLVELDENITYIRRTMLRLRPPPAPPEPIDPEVDMVSSMIEATGKEVAMIEHTLQSLPKDKLTERRQLAEQRDLLQHRRAELRRHLEHVLTARSIK